MDPADEIRATLDVLHKRGWHQGNLMDRRTSALCWFGARLQIVTNTYSTFAWTEPANLAFRTAMLGLFPERPHQIEAFNDDPHTTFEDIELVAKHAINDLELGEA